MKKVELIKNEQQIVLQGKGFWKTRLTINQDGIDWKGPLLNKGNAILWKEVDELEIKENQGDLLLKKSGVTNKIYSLFSLLPDLDSDTYYQFLEALEGFLKSLPVKTIKSPEVKPGLFSLAKLDCLYCGNLFKWNPDYDKNYLTLVKCDLCDNLILAPYCPKCGNRLPVLSAKANPKHRSYQKRYPSLDFSSRPKFWTCNHCHNRWKIPAETFDNIINVTSVLSESEQEKIKNKMKK